MSKQSEIYTHTLCGQNADFFNVPAGGRPTCNKKCTLKGASAHSSSCVMNHSQFCYSHQARHWSKGMGVRIHYPLVKVQ
jgi:hypothetical protein